MFIEQIQLSTMKHIGGKKYIQKEIEYFIWLLGMLCMIYNDIDVDIAPLCVLTN